MPIFIFIIFIIFIVSGAAVVWPRRIPFFQCVTASDGDRNILINQQRAFGTHGVDIVGLAIHGLCALRHTALNGQRVVAPAMDC